MKIFVDKVAPSDRQSRAASGELYPRITFVVTNTSRPPERVVAFYNERRTRVQRISGKGERIRLMD